jgi:hypothetical protein
MPPVGFEPTISAGERPQTYALDRTAAGTGNTNNIINWFYFILFYPQDGGSPCHSCMYDTTHYTAQQLFLVFFF